VQVSTESGEERVLHRTAGFGSPEQCIDQHLDEWMNGHRESGKAAFPVTVWTVIASAARQSVPVTEMPCTGISILKHITFDTTIASAA
jgi:hypothetical protein